MTRKPLNDESRKSCRLFRLIMIILLALAVVPLTSFYIGPA